MSAEGVPDFGQFAACAADWNASGGFEGLVGGKGLDGGQEWLRYAALDDILPNWGLVSMDQRHYLDDCTLPIEDRQLSALQGKLRANYSGILAMVQSITTILRQRDLKLSVLKTD